jgi:hypothetical protein
MIHYRINVRQFIDDDTITDNWISVVAEDSDDAIAMADNAMETLGCDYELLACEGGRTLTTDEAL